jgi:hypothetical protein
MKSKTLSFETLRADRIVNSADAEAVRRGRAYYYQGRARIEEVKRGEARVLVRGTRPTPYKVEFHLEDDGPKVQCDCPTAREQTSTMCKHKVAASLALQDYLRFHPPVTWETSLTKALQETGKRGKSAIKSLLFFSLQKRSSTWGIYPYSLPETHFPEEARGDTEALAKIIKEKHLSPQAKNVRHPADPKRFANADEESQIAARLVAMAHQYYFYYYDRGSSCSTFLPLLAHSPLFLGSEDNPLRKPLRISEEKAAPAIEISSTEDGLVLRTVLTLGDETLRLQSDKTQVRA